MDEIRDQLSDQEENETGEPKNVMTFPENFRQIFFRSFSTSKHFTMLAKNLKILTST